MPVRACTGSERTYSSSIHQLREETYKRAADREACYIQGIPTGGRASNAPKQFIQYLEEDNRPQVTEDVNYERGMGVSIGRLREDTMFDYKFIGLSHNTVRGAAGGAVLCAEALTAKGYIAAK